VPDIYPEPGVEISLPAHARLSIESSPLPIPPPSHHLKPMKLLNEIIDLSTSMDAPISVVLRKLLVLSYDLRNERLTTWATAELDGYSLASNIPDYRIVKAGARGTFTGAFGSGVKNQPLPSMILDKEVRHWATEVRIGSGMAEIETNAAAGGGRRPWPADMVMFYQRSFIEHMALAEAWQDLPGSVFAGIIGIVRNRALRFALELRAELGRADDDLSAIPSAKVDQNVTNFIYGGNVVIGGTSHRFSQTGTQTVNTGDQIGLITALGSLGFTSADVSGLLEAMKQDKAETTKPGIGKRAAAWVGQIGTAIGKAGLLIGSDVAKLEAAKLITGYLGLT